MASESRRTTTWWIIGAIGIVIYCLFPVLWIISLSFKAPSDLTNGQFLPTDATWGNYEEIFVGGASDLFLADAPFRQTACLSRALELR